MDHGGAVVAVEEPDVLVEGLPAELVTQRLRISSRVGVVVLVVVDDFSGWFPVVVLGRSAVVVVVVVKNKWRIGVVAPPTSSVISLVTIACYIYGTDFRLSCSPHSYIALATFPILRTHLLWAGTGPACAALSTSYFVFGPTAKKERPNSAPGTNTRFFIFFQAGRPTPTRRV